jgi:hypothetical protein
LYPGGDVYFGALINSWIHVMMYSYYTLSLLKIPCPWKKYLTMAQLTQFATVNLYSLISLCKMPSDIGWRGQLGISIQVFEMTSLFVLFLHFYRKAYSKKSKDDKAAAAAKAALQTKSTESTSAELKKDSNHSNETAIEQESVSTDSSDEE